MSQASKRSEWLEALHRHAAERPDAAAITEVAPEMPGHRSVSWSEFVQMVEARACVLAEAAPAGGHVLCALLSGAELAAWFAGSILAGVRLVLMHPRSGAGEFGAIFRRSRAACVLASNELLAHIDPSTPRVGAESPGPRCRALLDRGPGGVVLGSSGSTGVPKLVLRESPALDADAVAVARALLLTSDDTVLCVPPLCHSYGVDLLLGALYAGAELRIATEYEPVTIGAQLRAGGRLPAVTVLPGVPFVFESLARLEPGAARLRLAVSAGSPLRASVRESFTRRWSIEVGQLYGATELGTVAIHRPDEPGFDPASIGRPLPGVSFRILDTADPLRAVGVGELGELAVRAPSMLSSYVDDPLNLLDGHFQTGDLARIDDRGRVTLSGRLKLLIDAGGFKVNPLEVEAALLEHPSVRECAVVPMQLSDTIQRLTAYVSTHDNARRPDDRELRAFLRERLAPIKIPRLFEFVEALPRTPSGKLQRERLAPPAGSHQL